MTQPDWLEDEVTDDPRLSVWKEWAALLEEAKPSIAIVFKHLLAPAEQAEVEIFRALLKVITVGRMPKVTEGVAYGDAVDVWSRKQGEMLEDAKGVHHRYQGADSELMASPLAVWPPPIELVSPDMEAAEGASVCWEVKFNRAPSYQELRDYAAGTLSDKEWKGTTWFRKGEWFELSHFGFKSNGRFLADPQGRPTTTWFLKALDVQKTDRANFEIEIGPEDDLLNGTLTYAPQCAFCLERPGGEGTHEHFQCPLLGTLNKLRQQGELKPLRFSNGVLVREDVKVDLDLPKVVRAMLAEVADLKVRLDKVEKANPATAANAPSGQGKKRKPDEGGQGGSAAKKGKGGGQGGQGKPPSAGQAGKGKGKGMYRFW